MRKTDAAGSYRHISPRTITASVFIGAVLIAIGSELIAEAESSKVQVMMIDGVINALTERYLAEGLRDAARAQAELVVVRLNTPGGLVTSTRTMTEAILTAPVPVAVYVSPPGARAASAGMFLTLAGHIAAMAPGTNIGAAHPVGLGGRMDPVATEKLVNDAAAMARAFATARQRNAEWAERAVRESVSISATEALEHGVIDLLASDLDELLRRLDGRDIVTVSGSVTIRTAGATVVERSMSLPSRLLQAVTDPNIAYLLFTVGIIGLIAELYNPGVLLPGILGAISLIVAFVAFGSLPINWAGDIPDPVGYRALHR